MLKRFKLWQDDVTPSVLAQYEEFRLLLVRYELLPEAIKAAPENKQYVDACERVKASFGTNIDPAKRKFGYDGLVPELHQLELALCQLLPQNDLAASIALNQIKYLNLIGDGPEDEPEVEPQEQPPKPIDALRQQLKSILERIYEIELLRSNVDRTRGYLFSILRKSTIRLVLLGSIPVFLFLVYLMIFKGSRISDESGAGGSTKTPVLGVLVKFIDAKSLLKLGINEKGGVKLGKIESPSAAELAGFKIDDIIISFNGREIEKDADFPKYVKDSELGTILPVEAYRGGVKFRQSILLASDDQSNDSPDESPKQFWLEALFEHDHFSRNIERLAQFGMVAIFGAFGAFFSLMMRLQKAANPKALSKNFRFWQGSYASVRLAPLTGTLSAILLSFLFGSNLIKGELFPNRPEAGGWLNILYYHNELAKLLVWSFIAGFSERFVPNLVDRLVASNSAQKAKDETKIQGNTRRLANSDS